MDSQAKTNIEISCRHLEQLPVEHQLAAAHVFHNLVEELYKEKKKELEQLEIESKARAYKAQKCG